MIYIIAPPDIIVAPLDQTVSEFTRVVLTCVVSGVPLAQVEWLVDTGEGLEAINTSLIGMSGTVTDATRTLRLILPAITFSQTGTYVCIANSSLGQDTAQADIVVFGKPLITVVIQHTDSQEWRT